MPCTCICQCSCHNQDIPFSKLPRDQQEKLKREGVHGLPEKLLDAEGRKGRARLDRALALDAQKRKWAQRTIDNL